MSVSKISFEVFAIVSIIFVILLPLVYGHPVAPAPAPTNDGTAIDQSIGYVLMLVALALTYLIH
ncbi:PREDICTED: arabinogalactan peptide 22-like [Tarenaya hassleriana]|uniref:arabinogalactan peptide 22-like n=1 Tax=Tarenaya hassleriana TaxID=28532 RepID=UPI0008FD6F20|nr:PREDICTED: arabinogalactan peptide 22-like [Tarenaya hassleriana]